MKLKEIIKILKTDVVTLTFNDNSVIEWRSLDTFTDEELNSIVKFIDTNSYGDIIIEL